LHFLEWTRLANAAVRASPFIRVESMSLFKLDRADYVAPMHSFGKLEAVNGQTIGRKADRVSFADWIKL